MPHHARVQDLIAYVEQGRFLEAMREFYHDEATMQENSGTPRLGLPTCLDFEERFLETVQTFHEISARSFLVDGDRAAIHWVFDRTSKGGGRARLEEIAYQQWEGEKILHERFFYVPASPPASEVSDPEFKLEESDQK